jgi:hypothetical protein
MRYTLAEIRDGTGFPPGTTFIAVTDPESARLADHVLAMPHAYDALSYVADFGDDGPTCGCGGQHWSCPGNDPDDDWAEDDDEVQAIIDNIEEGR